MDGMLCRQIGPVDCLIQRNCLIQIRNVGHADQNKSHENKKTQDQPDWHATVSLQPKLFPLSLRSARTRLLLVCMTDWHFWSVRMSLFWFTWAKFWTGGEWNGHMETIKLRSFVWRRPRLLHPSTRSRPLDTGPFLSEFTVWSVCAVAYNLWCGYVCFVCSSWLYLLTVVRLETTIEAGMWIWIIVLRHRISYLRHW